MYSKKSLTIFKLTHIISFLVGVAPYSIKTSPCSPEKTGFNFRITYSRMGCAYNILLLCVFIGITIMVTPYLIEWHYADHAFSVLVEAALTMIGNIISIIVIFHYTLYQQRIILIGNQLSEFDDKYGCKFLALFRNDDSNRLKKIQNWTSMFISVFIWCGLLITSIYAEHISASVANFVTILVLNSLLMQYCSTVDELQERFEHLNQVLPMVFKCTNPSLEHVLFPRNMSNYRWITTNFLTFKQARTTLYKTSCLISEFYSFPMLLITFHCCCATIDTAYYFLITIVEAESFTLDNLCINIFFWFLICTYPTIKLCRAVQRFNTEMYKTADIVYDVIEMYASNKEIEYQLNNYALEVRHKKVDFTACGFFSLDCTLLLSIFGVFVTYLLILLQFKPKDVVQK